jgi:hypothetical protein
MHLKNKILASQIYLILTALFVTSLVVSNLIFQKFFLWNPFGWFPFELSVGLLPYPFTFLITDIISEIYGKKKANQVVVTGLFASFFQFLLCLLQTPPRQPHGLLSTTSCTPKFLACLHWPYWLLCLPICSHSLSTSGFIIFGNKRQKENTCGCGIIFLLFLRNSLILLL